MSMWLYSLTIHPLVQKIQSVIDESNSFGLNTWYADDGNVILSFDLMCRVLKILTDDGPMYGYFIKFAKCKYLIGKCNSLFEANQRKEFLLQLGFLDQNVIIHPDNNNNQTIKEYGVKCVGSFIGTNEFISKSLDSKIVKLRDIKNAIIGIPNKQIIHQLLRQSFSCMVNHLQRTIPFELLSSFIKNYDDLKREILQSIVGSEISSSTWTQACFDLKDGGSAIAMQ